jgi:hypothetical protein
MTQHDATRFENYARSCGYSTNKEGGRYCQGIVNQLKAAWCAAQEEMAGSADAVQQRYVPSRTRVARQMLSS